MKRIRNVSALISGFVLMALAFDLFVGKSLEDALINETIYSALLSVICWVLSSWSSTSSSKLNCYLASVCFSMSFYFLWLILAATSGLIGGLLGSAAAICAIVLTMVYCVPGVYKKQKKFIALCILPLGIGAIYASIVAYKTDRF